MEQRLRESLSALMDDETNELELERLLKSVGTDDELRGTWVRYNAVRAVVAGQPVSANGYGCVGPRANRAGRCVDR